MPTLRLPSVALTRLLALVVGASLVTGSVRAQVLPPNGPGQALGFDGINDRLTAMPSTLPAGNSPYTIEAWINPTVMNSGAIAAWGTFGTANRVNAFRLSPTGLVNYWWANDLSVTVNLVGDWHHVAATFDGTTRRILVDGVVVGNDTPVGHNATTANFSIASANNGEFFSGAMDEVRIWNVGRTAAQIQEAMRRQLFGNESGLVAYWRLDEGTGTSAFDATGNGANTVRLANGPTWFESSILPWAPEVGGVLDSILSATSVQLAGFGRAKNSATMIFFQWGATTNYGNVTPPMDFGSEDDPGFFFQPITGLTPTATYHARAVGTNAHGYSYSPDFTFMVPTNVVLNTNDSGFGSLREVIRGLTPGDTVRFASNLSGVIALTSGEIAITNSMNIVGPDASVLAVSGGGLSRLFRVEPGKKVLLSGLTLKNGIMVGASGASAPNLPPGAEGGQGGDAFGGAILNYGDLTVANCVLSGHDAVGGNGGAGQNAGGLAATAGGGGGGAYGGAIYGHNSARLTVVNCSLVTCEARGGQAGSGGFGTGGTAGASGGRGGEARGGAIYAANGCPLWITNCTFASNCADGGQGGQGGGGSTTGQGGQGGPSGGFALENSGPFALVGCTVAGNAGTPGLGGGGSVMGSSGQTGSAVYSFNPSPTNAVRNSIIAANQGGAPSSDVLGAFVSGGFNLIGVTNGVTNFTRSTDQAGNVGVPLAPRLLALDRYGGAYPVMPLATNSPALDRGISTGIPTDQRGLMRRVDDPTAPNAAGGDASDIGAVEMSALRIVSIQWVKPEEVVKVTFTTEPGRRYRLESRDGLVSGLWQPASDVVAGTGSWVSLVDPDPRPPARFYRVAIVP